MVRILAIDSPGRRPGEQRWPRATECAVGYAGPGDLHRQAGRGGVARRREIVRVGALATADAAGST